MRTIHYKYCVICGMLGMDEQAKTIRIKSVLKLTFSDVKLSHYSWVSYLLKEQPHASALYVFLHCMSAHTNFLEKSLRFWWNSQDREFWDRESYPTWSYRREKPRFQINYLCKIQAPEPSFNIGLCWGCMGFLGVSPSFRGLAGLFEGI